MKRRHLRTSDIAKAVGVHPNTVRRYEEWGFLPPIPRAPNNYRQFTESHLDQMRLAKTAMRCTWMGGKIRFTAGNMAKHAATGQFNQALELALRLQSLVRAEQTQAVAAAETLEQWAQGEWVEISKGPLQIGEAATLLDVTRDMLRNWEANGLIQVPRNPHNGYRVYHSPEIGRLRVIRLLRLARYSTMSILRMLLRLDQGQREDLRQVLDTPRPDEDVFYVADHWLSALVKLEHTTSDLLAQLRLMIEKHQS